MTTSSNRVLYKILAIMADGGVSYAHGSADEVSFDRNTPWSKGTLPNGFDQSVLSVFLAKEGSNAFTSNANSLYLKSNDLNVCRWRTLDLSFSDGKKVDSTVRVKNLAAGGVYGHEGALWMACYSGEELRYTLMGDKRTKKVLLPRKASPLAAMVAAPEALWTLSVAGVIFARVGVSRENPGGQGWCKIDTEQIESTNHRIVSVALSSDAAWAADDSGRCWLRLADPRHSGKTDTGAIPVWIPLEDTLQMAFITSSAAPHVVWALGSSGSLFARQGVFADHRIGVGWTRVGKPEEEEEANDGGNWCANLSAGEDRIWVRTKNVQRINSDPIFKALESTTGHAFSRCGLSTTDFVGQPWRRAPVSTSPLSTISSSACGKIFGLDLSGKVLTLEEKEVSLTSPKVEGAGVHLDEVEEKSVEGDWTLVE